jgi:hypothetical protein
MSSSTSVVLTTGGCPAPCPGTGSTTEGGTMSERDPMGVGEPDEADLAEDTLDPAGMSDEAEEEERAHDEEQPPHSGAETMADLDEEAGQTNRPGTERPPV